jgi:hypothetical protein
VRDETVIGLALLCQQVGATPSNVDGSTHIADCGVATVTLDKTQLAALLTNEGVVVACRLTRTDLEDAFSLHLRHRNLGTAYPMDGSDGTRTSAAGRRPPRRLHSASEAGGHGDRGAVDQGDDAGDRRGYAAFTTADVRFTRCARCGWRWLP